MAKKPKGRTMAKKKMPRRRRMVHVVEHTRSFPGTSNYKTARQRTTERKKIRKHWLLG